MQSKDWVIVGLLVVVVGGGGYLAGQRKDLAPSGPTPEVVVPEVQTVDPALVAVIKAANNPDAAADAEALWSAFAKILKANPSSIKTTGDLRDKIILGQKFALLESPHLGALKGFDSAANALMAQQLGLDDTTLDVPKAVRTIQVIAASCKE